MNLLIAVYLELFTNRTSESKRRTLLEQCLSHPKTQYGRCVYAMDNDVCDQQVVTMQFSDGATATMTMIATTRDTCERKTLVYGTRGQLVWDDARDDHSIEHFDFLTNQSRLVWLALSLTGSKLSMFKNFSKNAATNRPH